MRSFKWSIQLNKIIVSGKQITLKMRYNDMKDVCWFLRINDLHLQYDLCNETINGLAYLFDMFFNKKSCNDIIINSRTKHDVYFSKPFLFSPEKWREQVVCIGSIARSPLID